MDVAFRGTPSRVGGLTMRDLAQEVTPPYQQLDPTRPRTDPRAAPLKLHPVKPAPRPAAHR